MSSSKGSVYRLSFLFIIFLLFATTAESAEQWNLGLPNSFSAVNVTVVLNLTYLSQNSVPFVGAGGQITSDSANYSYYTSNGTLVLQKGIFQAINITTVANLTYLAQNSVPFIGSGGQVTQDAANFSYYTANGTMVVKKIQATAFNDSDNPSYYIDPASTGTSEAVAGGIVTGATAAGDWFNVGSPADSNNLNKTDGHDGIGIFGTHGKISLGYQLPYIEMLGNSGVNMDKWVLNKASNYGGNLKFRYASGTVRQNPHTGGNDILVVTPSGNLGINTSSFPSGGGTPVLVMAQAASAPTGMAASTSAFYVANLAGTARPYAIDAAGTSTKLTTGNDTLLAQSSLPMPYFVNFFNPYIGKDVEYDVGQAVSDLENITHKKYIYLREIPKEQWAQSENWRESEENNKSKNVMAEAWLRNASEMEVTPQGAFEFVWDNKTVTTGKEIGNRIEYLYDENGTVTSVSVPVFETKEISKQKRQLKSGVYFKKDVGKFYRKPTKAEAEAVVGEAYPHYIRQAPPKWMADRGAN